MLERLSSDMTLSVFSFFSSRELRNMRTVNKNIYKSSHHSLLWKNLLKIEFSVANSKDPQLQHAQLLKQVMALNSLFVPLSIYLGVISDIREKLLENKIKHPKYENTIALYGLRRRVENVHKILYSFDVFNQEFNSLKSEYPSIDVEKIKETIVASINTENNFNTYFNPSEFLFPCLFLNLTVIKKLIALNADVNKKINDIHYRSSKHDEATPLFIVLIATADQWDKTLRRHAKEIMQLFLKNGADPDANIITTKVAIGEDDDENSPPIGSKYYFTIREFCTYLRLDGESNISNELLELIINAPAIKPYGNCSKMNTF
jgi:hypothetical protein